MVLINPLLVEIEIERRLKTGGLPVRIRRTPSEQANAPTNKTEMWVRYVDSKFELIPSGTDEFRNYNRTMLFHVITEVMSLQNHERALIIHNNAIGLLTNWRPKIKIDPSQTECRNSFADIIKPLEPLQDRFERYADGKYQYRIDVSITVPHSDQFIVDVEDPTDPIDPENPKTLLVGFFRNKIDDVGSENTKDSDFYVNLE